MSEPRYTYRDVDPEWENEWQVEDADGIAAICDDEGDAERITACLNACAGIEDVSGLAGLDVAALLKAAKTALIFIETAGRVVVDDEYETLVVAPLRAALNAPAEAPE